MKSAKETHINHWLVALVKGKCTYRHDVNDNLRTFRYFKLNLVIEKHLSFLLIANGNFSNQRNPQHGLMKNI